MFGHGRGVVLSTLNILSTPKASCIFCLAIVLVSVDLLLFLPYEVYHDVYQPPDSTQMFDDGIGTAHTSVLQNAAESDAYGSGPPNRQESSIFDVT